MIQEVLMVTALYLTTFIVSLSMTVYYLARNSKVDNLLVCFGIILVLNSGGRERYGRDQRG